MLTRYGLFTSMMARMLNSIFYVFKSNLWGVDKVQESSVADPDTFFSKRSDADLHFFIPALGSGCALTSYLLVLIPSLMMECALNVFSHNN